MAFELSSWLVLVRSWILLGALTCSVLNGAMAIMMIQRNLRLVTDIKVLEVLVCIILVYTALAFIFQSTGSRCTCTGPSVVLIIGDLVSTALSLAIVTLLSQNGVPSNCAGLTDDDAPNPPDQDLNYTSAGFTDGKGNRKGKLDKYCAFERSFFFITVGFIFLFILTIVLAVLERADHAEQKRTLLDASPPSSSSPNPNTLPRSTTEPSPPSEGVITRATSVQSTLTAAISATSGDRVTLPSIRAASPSSLCRHTRPVTQGRPFPPTETAAMLDETVSITSTAEAGLVSDGIRPYLHPHQQTQPPLPLPMLREHDDEDHAAAAALVSDGGMMGGYMPGEATNLPPAYDTRIGGGEMLRHAGEGNDLRLSGYVKGETRAQSLKDAGLS